MNPIIINLKKNDLNDLDIHISPDMTYHIVISNDDQIYFFEIADTLLRFNSGVLLPTEAIPSANETSLPGLGIIASCLDYSRKHSDKRMLIAGHTDTVGSDEANITLSRIRAEAVHGLITGNRDQFANACWGPHLTDEQRYPDGGSGKKKGVLWDDYIDILNWAAGIFNWPCGYPNNNSTLWAATVNFQKNYNTSAIGDPINKPIPEYGSFDKKTWGAVYDCYEVQLTKLLKTDKIGLSEIRENIQFFDNSPEKHFVACGEKRPIDQLGTDNYRSQTNRRVEILFFNHIENPEIPCLNGQCSPETCLKNQILVPVPALPAESEIATLDVFVEMSSLEGQCTNEGCDHTFTLLSSDSGASYSQTKKYSDGVQENNYLKLTFTSVNPALCYSMEITYQIDNRYFVFENRPFSELKEP